MKQVFIHNPYFRLLCPPVYGLVVYLLVLLVFDSVGQITENFFSQEVLLCILLTYLLSESLRLMSILLNQYMPEEKNARLRMGLQLLANLLCSLLVISGGVALYFYGVLGSATFQIELITLNSIYLLTTLFYTMLCLSIQALQKYSAEKLARETALRKKMEHQLLQLQREVNPGLLYNSLETLLSLVQQDACMAEDFIDKLSSLYRYSLDHRHKELVPLDKELKAMQEMVYLYNRKYSGNIRTALCIAREEQTLLLIPGSLPDLAEAVILSTIMQAGFILQLDVYVENELLVLHYPCNDRLLLHLPVQETISRLTQMYRFFTDQSLVYTQTDGRATIKLPLLQEYATEPRRSLVIGH